MNVAYSVTRHLTRQYVDVLIQKIRMELSPLLVSTSLSPQLAGLLGKNEATVDPYYLIPAFEQSVTDLHTSFTALQHEVLRLRDQVASLQEATVGEDNEADDDRQTPLPATSVGEPDGSPQIHTQKYTTTEMRQEIADCVGNGLKYQLSFPGNTASTQLSIAESFSRARARHQADLQEQLGVAIDKSAEIMKTMHEFGSFSKGGAKRRESGKPSLSLLDSRKV